MLAHIPQRMSVCIAAVKLWAQPDQVATRRDNHRTSPQAYTFDVTTLIDGAEMHPPSDADIHEYHLA
jgi:hypothetical protein